LVTLTASAENGSKFNGWSGDPDCADGVLTMKAAKSCTATFALKPYTLKVSKAGVGSGTVTSVPGGIACGADCTEDYLLNTSVKLTAAPAAGWAFNGWSGDPDCADGEVSMSAAKSCTATFVLDPYFTLTVTKQGAGEGTVTSVPAGIDCGVDCTENYPAGTSVTLTPAASFGSAFAGWSGDRDCVDGVVSLAANTTCTATFEIALQAPRPLIGR